MDPATTERLSYYQRMLNVQNERRERQQKLYDFIETVSTAFSELMEQRIQKILDQI